MREKVCPQEWREKISQILEGGQLTVLVGAIDSGKTTFATFLVNEMIKRGFSCAVVDADVGQASIGPPGVISLGYPSLPVEELSQIPLASFYFVGAISPQGHLLPCVVGTKKMVEEARKNPLDHIIVDTTGLVHGGVGRVLKSYKLELLQPDTVVFFQRKGELEDLIRLWEERALVLRMPIPPEVGQKSSSCRFRYREEKWRRYFENSLRHRLPFREVVFSRLPLFLGTPLEENKKEELSCRLGKKILWAEVLPGGHQGVVVTEEALEEREILELGARLNVQGRLFHCHPSFFIGRIVGLMDKKGKALALGIVKEVNFQEGIISLLSPLREIHEVKEIQWGSYRLPVPELLKGDPL